MSYVQGARPDQRTMSGLEWVAKRMGSATTNMTLDLMIYEFRRRERCDDNLIAATGRPLNSLRCLTLRLLYRSDKEFRFLMRRASSDTFSCGSLRKPHV